MVMFFAARQMQSGQIKTDMKKRATLANESAYV